MSNGNTKLAAVALGGYVLGRAKKGRAAIRFAMWLSSNRGPLTDAASKALKNDDVAKLVGNVQGPLLEAVQSAALQAANARMEQLTNSLLTRSENLTKSVEGVTDTATDTVDKTTDTAADTVGKTTDTVTGALGGKKKDKSEESVDEQDDEQQEQGDDAQDDQPAEQDDADQGGEEPKPEAQDKDQK